jgi:hypothetical protein
MPTGGGDAARTEAGVGRLDWDPALAAAALRHCRMMAAAGPISHQYSGEPDLSTRAAQAGAHFSVIEENVAFAPSASAVHLAWMQSQGHRENLLSPEVDHVGISRSPGALSTSSGQGLRGGPQTKMSGWSWLSSLRTPSELPLCPARRQPVKISLASRRQAETISVVGGGVG